MRVLLELSQRTRASNLRRLDRNFDLNSRLDRDGGDLLDNLAGRVQVNQALVDAHFKAIPGLGTFTARRLARSLHGQ